MVCLAKTYCVTPPEEKYFLEEDIAVGALYVVERAKFGIFFQG